MPPAMLPSAHFDSVGTPDSFISRLNSPACTYPCPTLRPCPRGQSRMARGRRGSLLLRRRALSSPSPCRFIPALPKVHSIGFGGFRLSWMLAWSHVPATHQGRALWSFSHHLNDVS